MILVTRSPTDNHCSRNQLPASEFLPALETSAPGTNPTVHVSAKKTDMALGFDINLSKVAQMRSRARLPGSHQLLPLSHSAEEDTSTLPIQCAVEVKKETGNHLEAKAQLATWHAAGLGHAVWLGTLATRGGDKTLLAPQLVQVGWVVVGHRWELFFTLQSSSADKLVYVGPLLDHAIGTKDAISFFRLLAVLRALLKWLQDCYLPAFESLFNAAIERQQGERDELGNGTESVAL